MILEYIYALNKKEFPLKKRKTIKKTGLNRLLILIFTILSLYNGELYPQIIRELNKAEQDQIARLNEMAEIYLNEKDADNAGITYSRLAFVYWNSGRSREAIDNFINSANLYLQTENYVDVKTTYSNIGVIYTELEELGMAKDYFEKSLEVRRKIGNKNEIAAGLIDVAYIIQVIGLNDDAVKKLEEALKLATEQKNSTLIMDCYQLLSLNYEQIGNIRKANEFAAKTESYQAFLQEENIKKTYTEEIVETQQKVAKTEEEKRLAAELYALQNLLSEQQKDSMSLTIRAKQDSLFASAKLAEARSLKIENLEQQKKLSELEKQEAETKAKNQLYILIMIAGGFILMIFIAIVMFRANRSRKKANQKLEKQNKEIAEKSEQLGVALKKIAHQNQNITQSINYAKGIQRALLPKAEQLNDLIKDSFILFNPRDIVSGDFYYFREVDSKSDIFKIFGMHRRDADGDQKEKKSTKIVISAIDCTGHGVPGAFMSMIGYNLMDEITNKGITRPDFMLEELHRGVRFTLKQKETNNQDGMDMSICVIDKENKTMEFAGAKNPLIYFQDNKVIQIKGDKNGIGGKSDDHKFTSHTIDVSKPTWVYMFSDGFIDQFGGDQGRKFMIKNFREMLHKIHQNPMSEQKEYLNQVIKDWIGTKYNQIDDILIMGFKLNL
jgi:serine phosphatase RsbU (regulator of sigma subunit)